MESIMELPAWLVPVQHDQKFPRTKDHKEITRITYEALFERVVENMEVGVTASSTVKNDPRNVDLGNFMGWVRKDPERLSRFEEAKKNGMLILGDRLLEIVEDTESMEDVQRTKLRVDTLKWVMQSWDKRYRTSEKSDMAQSGQVTVVISQVESPYRQIESGVTIDG